MIGESLISNHPHFGRQHYCLSHKRNHGSDGRVLSHVSIADGFACEGLEQVPIVR